MPLSEYDPDYFNYTNVAHDFINQLDGADDLSPFLLAPSNPHGHVKPGRAYSAPTEAGIKQASFRLNQKKQLNKLRHDSRLTDFEIVVSPTEQSVSILCSTGFYTLVAVPSFAHTSVGTTHQVGDINMYCYDITGKIDDVGATVNAVIFYRMTNNIDKSSAGGVTVHLHHTVRRVQIQGSTMVTRQSRASVWFVENYLLERFTAESRSKSFDISSFNTAVNNLVSNHIEKINSMEKCQACSGHFNGRSIREQCRLCTQSYHKKCIQSINHPCAVPPGPSSLSRPLIPVPASSTNLVSFPSHQPIAVHQPVSDTASTPLLTLPLSAHGGDGSNEPASNVPTGGPTSSAPSSNIISNDSLVVTTTLDPSRPPFTPQPGTSKENQPRVPKNAPKSKAGVAVSKDGIALEFSRIEVNTIRARLKMLETKNKDLEFQNSILLERVSIFEKAEKEATYEKYFPKADAVPSSIRSGTTSLSPTPAPCSHKQTHCCHTSFHCCQAISSCQQSTPASPNHETLDIILNSLAELKTEVSALKSKVIILEHPEQNRAESSGPGQDGILHTGNNSDMASDNNSGKSSESVIDLDADVSVNTVDENTPELPAEESLNSPVLTSQLL